MYVFYHYTDTEGLEGIVRDGIIWKHEGSGLSANAAESVFLTCKDPETFNRLELLENNYSKHGCWRHRAKVSWFVRIEVKEAESDPFKDASLYENTRNLIVYKGDLVLSNFQWTFGRTPSHSQQNFHFDKDIEMKDFTTANRPDIMASLRNENYKVPSVSVNNKNPVFRPPTYKLPVRKPRKQTYRLLGSKLPVY